MKKNKGLLFVCLLLSTFSIKAQTAIEYEDSATKKAMNGDFNEAIVLYTKAIEINPNYGEAYHNRGLSFLSIENDTAALTDFSKAIELFSIKNTPAIEWSYANRGNILFRYQQLNGPMPTEETSYLDTSNTNMQLQILIKFFKSIPITTSFTTNLPCVM